MIFRSFKNELSEYIDLSKQNYKIKIADPTSGTLQINKNDSEISVVFIKKGYQSSQQIELFKLEFENNEPVLKLCKINNSTFFPRSDNSTKIFTENRLYALFNVLRLYGFPKISDLYKKDLV